MTSRPMPVSPPLRPGIRYRDLVNFSDRLGLGEEVEPVDVGSYQALCIDLMSAPNTGGRSRAMAERTLRRIAAWRLKHPEHAPA